MGQGWWRTAAVALGLLASGTGAWAAPGDLDPSFGGDGIVVTADGTEHEDTHAAVALPDGRLVVAGYVYYSHLWLVRLRSDGGLDPSFGVAGRVTTPLANGPRAYALARQADGKLVVAGDLDTGTTRDVLVVRYEADGALDPTFGSGGIVQTTVGGFVSTAYALVVQSDGRIVVAGTARIGSREELAVVRYLADGSLDASFGGDGIVTVDLSGGSDPAFTLALQSDGRLVAAGAATGGDWRLALVRLEPDGTLDPTFDDDGIVTLDLGSGVDAATAVVVQPGGRIVTAGPSDAGGIRATLTGFTAAGALDPTFGDGGVTTTDAGADSSNATCLAVAPDGALFVGGWARFGSQEHFALLRYTADGALDPAFGNGGIVTTAIGFDASARDIALYPDGRVALVGPAATGLNDDTAAARYLGTALCGNGVLESGETCDDGNAEDGDCCSASCAAEAETSPCADDGLPCTADRCDGAGSCIHPPAPVGTVCRAATGACDLAETCDGISADCPGDAAAPDGTTCADPLYCNGAETCAAGICAAGNPPCPLRCDEDTDACVAGCPAAPRAGCGRAATTLLRLKPGRMLWNWTRGPAIALAELGTPDASTHYVLCVYGADGSQPAAISVPPGPRWRAAGTRGWRYADPAAATAGLRTARLIPGAATRAKLLFKGSGATVPSVALPLPPAAFPLRVQLLGDDISSCWESEFGADQVRRNETGSLLLKAR